MYPIFNINEKIKSKKVNTYLCSRSIVLFLSSSINHLLTSQVFLATFLGQLDIDIH